MKSGEWNEKTDVVPREVVGRCGSPFLDYASPPCALHKYMCVYTYRISNDLFSLACTQLGFMTSPQSESDTGRIIENFSGLALVAMRWALARTAADTTEALVTPKCCRNSASAGSSRRFKTVVPKCAKAEFFLIITSASL